MYNNKKKFESGYCGCLSHKINNNVELPTFRMAKQKKNNNNLQIFISRSVFSTTAWRHIKVMNNLAHLSGIRKINCEPVQWSIKFNSIKPPITLSCLYHHHWTKAKCREWGGRELREFQVAIFFWWYFVCVQLSFMSINKTRSH